MSLVSQQTIVITQAFPVVGPALIVLGTLKVIDVTDPTLPSVIGQVPTPPLLARSGDGSAYMVDSSDHICYIVDGIVGAPDGDNRLEIVDVSDLANPVLLSQSAVCSAPDAGRRVALANSKTRLYCPNANVVATPNILQVFDVANLSAPVGLIATYDLMADFAITQNDPSSAMAVGNTLYIVSIAVADVPVSNARLGVYDVTNPLAVTQLGATTVRSTLNGGAPGTVSLLDIVGNIAWLFVEDFPAGTRKLQAWDISNPALATLTGTVNVGVGVSQWSQVANNVIYGIRDNSAADVNIYAYDVSNPAAPALLGATVGVGPRNFSIRASASRNEVYVCTRIPATESRLRVYDSSNPAVLVELGSVAYNATGSRQTLHMDF